jgi:trehalose 6-phosphate phosphatase
MEEMSPRGGNRMGEAWIEDFRRERIRSGIFLDFDGTISEIAPEPVGARLHPRARELLGQLSGMHPLCIVSGRRVRDLVELVGLPHTHYVGVHGMEWWEAGREVPDPDAEACRPAVEKARRELEDRLTGHPGLVLEDKAYTLTIHYRQDPGAGEEVKRWAQEVAAKHGLVLREGRMAVELRPPVEVDKGTVVARLCVGWDLKRALYAGDDHTDLDAFRGLRRLMREGGFEGIAVAVHSGETPVELVAVADIVVEGVEGLLDLLERLLFPGEG